MSSAGQTFEREQIVRWGDSDPAGILYGPRSFEYGVGLVEELFVHLFGVGFDGFQRKHKVLLTWVHLGCDFRRPAATSTVLTLRLGVERLGTSSVTYRIDALGAGGETHFRLQMVSATVAMATGRPAPLVAEHRDALGPYVARAEPPKRPLRRTRRAAQVALTSRAGPPPRSPPPARLRSARASRRAAPSAPTRRPCGRPRR